MVQTPTPGTRPALERGVTAPRRIIPGATYLVTRRCTQRQFLLRPTKLTRRIFLFVLAVAARRYNVQVHAYCVLSNHAHLVLTDPDARLPQFMQYVNSLVARATNASLGRWESFWASSSYSAVPLTTREDVTAKTAYVLANPVAAGLVTTGREWPGLWSAPDLIGGPRIIETRPAHFFSDSGTMPERVELALSAPPGFASAEEFRRLVVEALADEEEKARAEIASSGRRFAGVARVLAQHPFGRPAPGEPRRKLNPRAAVRDKWKRIEALARLAAFVDRYRAALDDRRAGNLDAVFPAGTYLMRVAHGVPCAVT
jgi:REP element-mobilizing transposase RayT